MKRSEERKGVLDEVRKITQIVRAKNAWGRRKVSHALGTNGATRTYPAVKCIAGAKWACTKIQEEKGGERFTKNWER